MASLIRMSSTWSREDLSNTRTTGFFCAAGCVAGLTWVVGALTGRGLILPKIANCSDGLLSPGVVNGATGLLGPGLAAGFVARGFAGKSAGLVVCLVADAAGGVLAGAVMFAGVRGDGVDTGFNASATFCGSVPLGVVAELFATVELLAAVELALAATGATR